MKIVVIGGTGLIGSKTVAILRQGGHEVLAASPNTGVNTITGEGLKTLDATRDSFAMDEIDPAIEAFEAEVEATSPLPVGAR